MKLNLFTSALVLIALLFSSCVSQSERHLYMEDTTTENFSFTNKNISNVKAMWISQFDLYAILQKDGKQRPEDELRSYAVLMMSNLRLLGINTVFIQARPNGDSLYPSDIFPKSSYIGGDSSEFDYDPFKILIDEARRALLSPHIWINPLRCMKPEQIETLDGKYILKKWYSNREYNGTRLVESAGYAYLNPAYDEVIELIASGADEALKRYGADGLHIDDYFYPTTDERFDKTAYTEYLEGGGRLSLADFRRNNVNKLVSALHSVAEANGRVFGVSPGGNQERNYSVLFADVEGWCRDGSIDYLCPQIYFGIEHETLPFEMTCKYFAEMTADYGIPMIVGMTVGKAKNGYSGIADEYAGIGKNEWINSTDVLKRCIEITASLECRGVSLFSYQYFFNPNGSAVTETKEEIDNFLPVFKEITYT